MSSGYFQSSRLLICVCFVYAVLTGAAASVLAQGRGGAPAPPRVGRAAASFDPTGYWVSLVTEDWRFRIVTPPKGDYEGIPLSPVGRAKADMWDPAKDEAAGEQCRAYGAGGIMFQPTRLHITWQDDMTLKIETDAGMQTRLIHFGALPEGQGLQVKGGDWQGVSMGTWEYPRQQFITFPGFPARAGGPPPGATLKVVTTQMKRGYLRKNGVPYGEKAVLTEYFDRFDLPGGGGSLLVVKQELVDPENLSTPYWVSPNFRKQNDASGWNPTPCAAR